MYQSKHSPKTPHVPYGVFILRIGEKWPHLTVYGEGNLYVSYAYHIYFRRTCGGPPLSLKVLCSVSYATYTYPHMMSRDICILYIPRNMCTAMTCLVLLWSSLFKSRDTSADIRQVNGITSLLPLYTEKMSFLDCGSILCANGPLARYIKVWVAHAPGMPGTFPLPPTSKESAS